MSSEKSIKSLEALSKVAYNWIIADDMTRAEAEKFKDYILKNVELKDLEDIKNINQIYSFLREKYIEMYLKEE